MYIDMHVHSKRSDDAGGTVEGYLKWISVLRNKGFHVDGIVLTEHRTFDIDADYSALSRQYSVAVFKGSEIETNLGHVLIYGVTPWLLTQLDFSNVNLDALYVFRVVKQAGAYAIPAHPGRTHIGLAQHIKSGVKLPEIDTIEKLNGGSNIEENEIAARLAIEHGLKCVGGSDSHYVSTIGKYITKFNGTVTGIEDLVSELSRDNFSATTLEGTRG